MGFSLLGGGAGARGVRTSELPDGVGLERDEGQPPMRLGPIVVAEQAL